MRYNLMQRERGQGGGYKKGLSQNLTKGKKKEIFDHSFGYTTLNIATYMHCNLSRDRGRHALIKNMKSTSKMRMGEGGVDEWDDGKWANGGSSLRSPFSISNK